MPDLPYIDEQIRSLAIPIDSVFPDPVNAKDHPEESIAGIAASLKEFGQAKPIVVREETMIICCGNGTWMAAKRLGWTHIAANIREMDALTATKLALIDNRTPELGGWKKEVLDQLMPELTFDDPTLTEMMAKLDAELKAGATEPPPGEAPKEFPAVDEKIETQYKCPNCSYSWSGKPS